MYVELYMLYARTRTDVKKISLSCLEASWTRISPDQKFRKHFDSRSIVASSRVLHAIRVCLINPNETRRRISFDKYLNTNFPYFSIPRAHPQTLHSRSWIAMRLKRHVRRQCDPSGITSPSEN